MDSHKSVWYNADINIVRKGAKAVILLKNTHMPQKTEEADAHADKRSAVQIPCDKKWIVFRCLIIFVALSDLYCEGSWLVYFYNKTCEWLEPSFADMMEYRHIIRFSCSLSAVLWALKRREVATHSVLGQKWKPGQTMVCLFFISYVAISAISVLYNIRWMETFGWDKLYVSEIVIIMLLLPVWELFLFHILPPWCIVFSIVLDMAFYYLTNRNHLGAEGIWINTYYDIVEKGVFSLLMILVVMGTRIGNKRYPPIRTEI